eukprot:5148664-Alexandrium_andersonii.AAC.1
MEKHHFVVAKDEVVIGRGVAAPSIGVDHTPVDLATASPTGGAPKEKSPPTQVPSPPSKSKAARLLVEVPSNDQPR